MEKPKIQQFRIWDGCLSSPDLILGSWRIPRELLVFSRCWNLKTLISTKECLSDRVNELASEREGKQAKSKVSLLHVFTEGGAQL